jgi:hypothetical protein
VLLIALFGFLPWCEVSCSAKDFGTRFSQSGYQAVYGSASAPLGVQEAFQAGNGPFAGNTKADLIKKVDFERSDFLMACSPFLAIFWAGNLSLLALIVLAPVSRLRMQMFLGITALMLVMLVCVGGLGTPPERRADTVVGQLVKNEPQQAIVLASLLNSGKTAWFW